MVTHVILKTNLSGTDHRFLAGYLRAWARQWRLLWWISRAGAGSLLLVLVLLVVGVVVMVVVSVSDMVVLVFVVTQLIQSVSD